MAARRVSLRRFRATNIARGTRYGTALLWVVVLSSPMAIVVQVVAAKLGIASDTNTA